MFFVQLNNSAGQPPTFLAGVLPPVDRPGRIIDVAILLQMLFSFVFPIKVRGIGRRKKSRRHEQPPEVLFRE